MKKGAALLLALLLLITLALPAQAEGQGLLYPGVSIQGDSVYLLGVSLSGGTVQATANGQAVSCTSTTLQQTGLGVTYYCVVSVTSSLSDVQREQQRAGLIAISQSLGANDSMVLVSMGQEITFGERLTTASDLTAAIDQVCNYATFGTNLYEAIDTVLATAAASGSFSSVVFFTDGCDHTNVVKYTEEQIGRIVQNSGLCVSFLALLTPPVSNFASGRAELMGQYAGMSMGGVYHAPLLEDQINYIAVMENVGREIVNQSAGWTAFQLNAAELPRDSKTVELSLTWTDGATTLTGSAQVDTASLPALPEPTQPETEPETVPETTETLPPTTEATEPVPEFQPENESRTLYYAAIGGAAVLILVLLFLLIATIRKAARRKKRKKYRTPLTPDARENQNFVPVLPKKAPVRTERVAEEPAPEKPAEAEPVPVKLKQAEEAPAPEVPEKVEQPIPAEPEETEEAPTPEAPTEIKKEPAPAEPEKAEEEITEAAPEVPAEEAPKEESIPEEPEQTEEEIAPTQPEKAEQNAPKHPENLEDGFSLEALFQSIKGSAPQPEAAEEAPIQAPSEKAAAEPIPETSEEELSMEELYKLLGEIAPEEAEQPREEIPQAVPETPVAEAPAWEEPEEPIAPVQPEKPKKQAAPAQRAKTATPLDLSGFAPTQEPKRRSLFHRRERWIDDVGRPDPAPVEPAPKAPNRAPTCTVRLMPEGNPGGSVYVTMEAHNSRTLGRNQKADIILNQSDSCLSGLHFELQWDGRVLYLTDRGSTNGTAITGVPQKPGRWARVESGATIQAGNTKYKVRITKS